MSDVTQLPRLPTQLDALREVDADYRDAFRLNPHAHPGWTARTWVRHVLEEAPLVMRSRLVLAWTALGLDVRPWRADRVLGWQIRSESPQHVLLHAGSRIGMPGEVLVATTGRILWMGTFVVRQNRAARALWSRAEEPHVRTVRTLLQDADLRLAVPRST